MTPQHSHEHQSVPANNHAHQQSHEEAMAEILDLDAILLRDHLSEIFAWTAELAGDARSVVDLGAGTGTGTLGLARAFPDATVVAVDQSEYMLTRLKSSVEHHGLAARINTLQADLDTSWPALGEVDLIWAASSMHHMSDPARVFTDIHQSLAPQGLLVVVEMDTLPRYLPEDIGFGTPGVEQRCHEIVAAEGWNSHPNWRPGLEAAGFELAAQRTFTYQQSDNQTLIARTAESFLARMCEGLTDKISAEDLESINALLDPSNPKALTKRSDLLMRGSRTVWAARRA